MPRYRVKSGDMKTIVVAADPHAAVLRAVQQFTLQYPNLAPGLLTRVVEVGEPTYISTRSILGELGIPVEESMKGGPG